MTSADRRLACLAAALAGAGAAALLQRLSAPAGAEAARLAATPRPERLRTLAAELAPDPRARRERIEALAAHERSAVAGALASLSTGAGGGVAAVLRRLCLERVDEP